MDLEITGFNRTATRINSATRSRESAASSRSWATMRRLATGSNSGGCAPLVAGKPTGGIIGGGGGVRNNPLMVPACTQSGMPSRHTRSAPPQRTGLCAALQR